MILIPMAGQSSRFFNEGYDKPKHLLPLHGFNVFYWALRSLEFHFDTELFVFVNQRKNRDRNRIAASCSRLGIRNFEIFSLDFFTSGQAQTIYEFTKTLPLSLREENLNIFNIDTIRPKLRFPSISKPSGWLEVFEGPGEHWSFAEEDPSMNNRAIRIAEKVRISNWCSTGAYSFGSINLFNATYMEFYSKRKLKSEKYVSWLLQHLIDCGHDVTLTKIPAEKMIPCGNPIEYLNCQQLNFDVLFK